MNELKITLDKFQLRWYQVETWKQLFGLDGRKRKRRFICVWPRRAGKDIMFWNAAILQCLSEVCSVFYVFKDYSSAKRCIWDSISTEGIRFLDYVPSQLVESMNVSDLKIIFTNGSILRLVGADTHNTSLRGTNPKAIIMSEYGYYDSEAILDTITPILAANHGWLAIVSTPNGSNFYKTLVNLVKEYEFQNEWYVSELKTSVIKHISEEELAFAKRRMSVEMYEQEFECSFSRGIDGAVFGRELQRIRDNDQICFVPWEPHLSVHTAWDLGLSKGNAMCILFFQVNSGCTKISIIDSYSNEGLGLDHYAKIVKDKPYTYGTHFAPHDMAVREHSDAATRYAKLRNLGIQTYVMKSMSVEDSIENVLTHFSKLWIDDKKCSVFIEALENYYREWDEVRRVYSKNPVHNWASNYADALRYLCQGIYKTEAGLSGYDYDKLRSEKLGMGRSKLAQLIRGR